MKHLNCSCCRDAVQWPTIVPGSEFEAGQGWKKHACSVKCPLKTKGEKKTKVRWWISSMRWVCTCDFVVSLRQSSYFIIPIQDFTIFSGVSNSSRGSSYVLWLSCYVFRSVSLFVSPSDPSTVPYVVKREKEKERMCPVDHHTGLAQIGSKNRLQDIGPTYYQHLLVNTLLYNIVSVRES